MKITFSDLSAQHKDIRRQMAAAINNVIKRGDFILGEDVSLFEREFSKFSQSRFCAGVSSGTAALFLALDALGIGTGDEVIVPAYTYIATAFAVSYTGARPVFVDIDEQTYNIDAAKIESAITRNTKAIIPVHLYGQPADMARIIRIARKYNLKVIEDAAQAHAARVKIYGTWHLVGGIGDVGCFSFYPSKNLGALGDAGMAVCNNEDLYKRLMMLRDCGRVSKYEHAVIGYNSRLDTLQAAILRVKLKKLKQWNARRCKAAGVYNLLFKDVPGIITPFASQICEHVYHCYVIRTPKRDKVVSRLKEKGVSVIIHYPLPLHLQPAYRGLGYKRGDFPVSEKVSGEIVSLPMFPHITSRQIKYVVDTIKGAL